MWVFTRRRGERVVVAPGMVVEVTEIQGDSVELTFRTTGAWPQHESPARIHLPEGARRVAASPQALEDTVRSGTREESRFYSECP